jgi:flagellar motility protein MotE (MotC chaperone)
MIRLAISSDEQELKQLRCLLADLQRLETEIKKAIRETEHERDGLKKQKSRGPIHPVTNAK